MKRNLFLSRASATPAEPGVTLGRQLDKLRLVRKMDNQPTLISLNQ